MATITYNAPWTARSTVTIAPQQPAFVDVAWRSQARLEAEFLLPEGTDPITGRVQYRLIICDRNGDRYAELQNATLEPMTTAFGEIGGFSFSLPNNDEKIEECLLPEREVQVWRGRRLVWWGVLVRARGDDRVVQFECQTLDWYFTRRYVGGRRENLLVNGDFEQGPHGWRARTLPVGENTTPDFSVIARSNRVIAGSRAVRLSPKNTGRLTETLAADAMFAGADSDVLSSYGKTELRRIAKAARDRRWITVEVHSDDQGTRSEREALTEDRAASIREYLADYDPDGRVRAYGSADSDPVDTNSTPAGRTANRRVEITYKPTGATQTGHQQFWGQMFEYRNPEKSRRKRKITVTAWVYVKSFAGPAQGNFGLYVEKFWKKHPHYDQAWADAGYGRPMGRAYVPIDGDTPLDKFIRMETSVIIPPDGRLYQVEVRCYPPDGVAFYNLVWATDNDALHWRKEEQAEIIKGLLRHAQDTGYGKSDLNITARVPDTGVKRTRTYPFDERMNVYEALSEFNTLADGVEWEMRVNPDRRILVGQHPRLGKRTDVVLAEGSNVLDYEVDVDATITSTKVIVQAEGEDNSGREEGYASDASLLDGLVLEHVYAATPGSAVGTLDKQADRGLARYRRDVVVPSITCKRTATSELLRKVRIGDVVKVDVRSNYVEAFGRYRVNAITLDPRTDQLTYAVTREDVKIKTLIPWADKGWKYLNQDQKPITGASNDRPVESNTSYGDDTFDDSSWATCQTPVGWTKPGDPEPRTTRNTTIPYEHEVWIRKDFRATADVLIYVKAEHFGYLYVNGHLIRDYVIARDTLGKVRRGPFRVKQRYLNRDGRQTVAFHVQAQLAPYDNTPRYPEKYLVADVKVIGSYDPTLVER